MKRGYSSKIVLLLLSFECSPAPTQALPQFKPIPHYSLNDFWQDLYKSKETCQTTKDFCYTTHKDKPFPAKAGH